MIVRPALQSDIAGLQSILDATELFPSDMLPDMIADTSGTDDFAETRKFYLKQDYTQEARIRDFWAPGDDKVVFWKPLSD